MQKALLYNFFTIGGLALLLLIPLTIIDGVISERKYYRDEVVRNIAKSSTGSQLVTGAILVAPYKETVMKEVEIYKQGEKQTVLKPQVLQRYKYFLPENININGQLTTEERHRGIYKVPVYTAELAMDGRFSLPKNLGLTGNINNIEWQKPYVILGIKDVRGINNEVTISINNKALTLFPGTKTRFIPKGVHAPFVADNNQEQSLEFKVKLELQGMEKLLFLPTASYTDVKLSSSWQHPSFIGEYLPKGRHVTDSGFSANWNMSLFSSNILQNFEDCSTNNVCKEFNKNFFGVSLLEGVDIYLKSERSIKYALLFIILTFVVFFLFEVLKGLPIHAVQYGLVGVALALFYFLLISLSEHIAFKHAYSIASAACVSLLCFYVTFVLRSVFKGVVFGATLIGLYALLYSVIRSQDYALLMGSVLLFGILTFVMVITRNVDWHQIGVSNDRNSHRDVNA